MQASAGDPTSPGGTTPARRYVRMTSRESLTPVGAAELAHGLVDLLGPLEIAELARARDHDELRVRDRVLELACDAERRTRVELAPDQQGRRGDAGQQV